MEENPGMIVTIVCLAIAGLAVWFLLPFFYRKAQEWKLGRICRENRLIVLSYDDGPGSELTDALRHLLLSHGARASFFHLGRHVDLNPTLARQLVADGHEVGSHTQNHSNAWKTGPIRFSRDTAKGMRTISALGSDGSFFRPPYGKLTMAAMIEGFILGTRFGWWTIDSQDSWKRRPIEDVLSEIEARGGGVVLMHDFDNYETPAGGRPHKEHVLELTRQILEMADKRKYRIVTLGELQFYDASTA
jgi:peptidoglycan/xylan/chitin deacetylase (PgdA/CDA1 family)